MKKMLLPWIRIVCRIYALSGGVNCVSHLCLQYKSCSNNILQQQWNSLQIYEAIQAGQKSWAKPKKSKNPTSCMVWRADYDVYFKSLDAQQAMLLNAALQGKMFGQMCEELHTCINDEQQLIEFAAAELQFWLYESLITKIDY